MKQEYIQPTLEIYSIDVQDVLTASPDQSQEGQEGWWD